MAVYTEISDEELQRFIDGYGLGALLSYKGIAEGVENSNYLVHVSRGTFILTLYEKRVDPNDLPFFLGLMEHLNARGVTCPLPVRDLNGQMLNMIAGRHAAFVTFLEGVWPRRPTAEHALEVGRAMARMHVASEGFPLKRRNALGLEGWAATVRQILRTRRQNTAGTSQKLSAYGVVYPEAALAARSPSGVIHADLFPDNVFFITGKLSGLIDFYFACNDACAYDLAICSQRLVFRTGLLLQRHQRPRADPRLRGGSQVDRRRTRSLPAAGTGRGPALPPDARLRLAQHPARRAGCPQGSVRLCAAPALPSECDVACGLRLRAAA